MKHLLIILGLVVVGYGAWQLVPAVRRDNAVKRISRHGLRLGALVAVVLALVVVAWYTNSIRIL